MEDSGRAGREEAEILKETRHKSCEMGQLDTKRQKRKEQGALKREASNRLVGFMGEKEKWCLAVSNEVRPGSGCARMNSAGESGKQQEAGDGRGARRCWS